jgi:hypothetical protein
VAHGLPAPRRLDLDHFGAQLAQIGGAGRPEDVLGAGQDPDAFEDLGLAEGRPGIEGLPAIPLEVGVGGGESPSRPAGVAGPRGAIVRLRGSALVAASLRRHQIAPCLFRRAKSSRVNPSRRR